MDANLPPQQRLDPFANKMFTGSGDLYAPYLGPVPQTLKTDGYERRAVDKWNMPENYRGKNLYIRDTIEDLVWTADQTWYTSPNGVMPWKVTDELHLQWTNLTANAHIMDVTPYQGTSSLTTQERQIRRASLIRRGIAAEFEHDFLKTPMGRVSFLATLNQISRSVQETANLEVIRALVQAHRYQHEWQRKFGIIREKDFKSYLENDKFRFAIVQKVKNGLEKLGELINSEVRDANGYTDCWILHENVKRYTEIVPPERTDYYLAGSRGPDRVNKTGAVDVAMRNTGDPADSVQVTRVVDVEPVYLARNFNIPDMPKMDVMARNRQVGEYNTMLDENTDYSNYRSDSRNIAIYNEDIDDFSKITLEDAIINCGLWEEGTGKLKPLTVDTRNISGGDIRDAKRDFLTYIDADGKPRSVQNLRDIDPLFLPTKVVLNAAQTLDNRIRGVNAYQPIIRSILGLPAGANVAIEGNVQVPVVRRQGVLMGNNVDNASSEREIEDGFMEMLKASTPTSKRDEILEIAGMAGSFADRVETIKKKFHDYATEKVRQFKLKTPEKVEQFFQDRLGQLQNAKEEARQAQIAASSVRSQAGVQEREIVGYRAPGLDLSGTDVEYLYKGSERASTGDHLHDSVSQLRILNDRIHDLQQQQGMRGASSVGARARDTGAGLGIEGLGQMAFGDTRGRQGMARGQVDPLLAELRNQAAASAKHLGRIVESGSSRRLQVLASLFLEATVTRESMLRLARANVVVPLNFLLFRPHMQYKMRMGIKAARGGRTGHLWYGNTNAMIQGEVSRKISQLHFTMHMRGVVETPQNVYVQPDIYSEEYIGGNGIKFFTPETYRIRDDTKPRFSIICVAIPPAERDIPSPMDSSGRWYVEYNAQMLTDEEFQELHYTTAFRYNTMYGFYEDAKRQGANLSNYIMAINVGNRTMYQGHQWMFNTKTNAFDRVRVNKGHWGKNVYAGVGEVRNGNLKHMEQIDYTKYSTI